MLETAASLFEMLVIRSEQMRALVDAGLPGEIEATMRRLFPDHCERLGKEGCAAAVRAGIDSGRRHGFRSPELAAYVALEFCFGVDFAENPAYPWTGEILRDRSLPSEERMQKLRSKAIFYLAKMAEAQQQWATAETRDPAE